MQSKARDVAAYLLEVPEDRRKVLQQLRTLCREVLVGYEEVMEYGSPGYKKNGVIEVAFASQKNFIALYILKKPVLDANRAALAGLSVGKGCIRYSRPEKLEFETIRRLLIGTVESTDPVC